jgi:hypothetical protein
VDSLKIWEESRKSTIYPIGLLDLSGEKETSRTIAADIGDSLKARPRTAHLLASAHTCAQRVQISLESLGCASNLLLLTGMGTNLVLSYLTGLIIDGGLRPATADGQLGRAPGLWQHVHRS